ncbi:MAG: TRAP transporter substrate-binding protein [Oscillospiraceae bacterium]|nr:TRAP transporter substrate-binding protein [Oscillospiraceae bacterium]
MKKVKWIALLLVVAMMACMFAGCGGAADGKRIIRIGHNQATTHPTHIGLTAFAEFINEELGDKYQVEVYPSELLGSQNEMVQLTQTGAIDIVIASNAIMETFSSNYSIFNLPYLFSSAEAYHAAMEDPEVTDPIFLATEDAGFVCVTWLDAGTRNFYTVDKPINSPADLKGLKIRVQQSATNVKMMELLGGTATPMGFGDVYTALQSQIINGAENNELALTSNGHGDVCKYYSYDMHQMVPDLVLCNWAFLEGLSEEERAIFDEGFQIINTVQREAWETAVEEAKEQALNEQGVNFLYPDTAPFQEAVMPLHEEILAASPELQPIYDMIQEYNAQYSSAE